MAVIKRVPVWFYIELGKRIGPVTEKKIKVIAKSGALPEQTLVWTHALTDWIPMVKAFPPEPTADGAPAPVSAAEIQKAEKLKADYKITPESGPVNVHCCVCHQKWLSQFVVVTRSGWVCVQCKDKMDREALKGFDPAKMPRSVQSNTPVMLALAVMLLVAGGVIFLQWNQTRSKSNTPFAIASTAAAGKEDPEPAIELWKGAARKIKGQGEEWAAESPENWPTIVVTHNAEISEKLQVKGGSGVLVRSQDQLFLLTSTSIFENNLGQHLQRNPALPDGLFARWMVGCPLKPAHGLNVLHRVGDPEDYKARDAMVFEVTAPKEADQIPALALLPRLTPLEETEPVYIVVHNGPQAKESQRVIPAQVEAILGQGTKIEASSQHAYLPRELLGAPIIDLDGYLVGVVTAQPDAKLDLASSWITGETISGILPLLEGVDPAAASATP